MKQISELGLKGDWKIKLSNGQRIRVYAARDNLRITFTHDFISMNTCLLRYGVILIQPTKQVYTPKEIDEIISGKFSFAENISVAPARVKNEIVGAVLFVSTPYEAYIRYESRGSFWVYFR